LSRCLCTLKSKKPKNLKKTFKNLKNLKKPKNLKTFSKKPRFFPALVLADLLTELTVRLLNIQETVSSNHSALDCIESEPIVHQHSLAIRAFALYDVIERDVIGRGQHAGDELLDLTRDR